MAQKYGKKVKEIMVDEMKNVFTENAGFVFSQVEKIKSSEIDKFRKKMRQSGSRYMIVKNRIADLALKEAGITELCDTVNGKHIWGVGVIKKDPVNVAKIMVEFSKENSGFKISNGYLEGRMLEAVKIKELSELPSREQLIAMVLGTMNAPITNFVGVLAAVIKSLLYALKAVKEKKQEQST
ncbi:MAG: 50S ribosomal protein L10 [Candidatus Omnitrophota bacterium]|nr:50S ribosomal protein L10 [Candidatus Omnitrophota bacterium]MBU1895050.1 50S ribosomal protein L10 [Candidatus Omnitrophota bacterium]